MHALAITLGWESYAHLRTHPVKFPARLTSLSRNDTLCANLLADVPVVALAVKLRIGHNGSNAVAWNLFIEQRSQGGAVINGSLMSLLREDQAQARINSQEPFDPVTPRHRSTAMLLTPTNEKRANGSRSQPRSIYRHGAFSVARGRLAALKTAHHFGQNLGDHFLLYPQHKTKQRAVIGHRLQFQRSPQLTMLGQTNFCCAKRPVLVTHQTQNRQQLRLIETLRRKTMTVSRHNFPAHFQRHTGKRHKSNFAHALLIYTQLQIVQVPFQQSHDM